MEVIMQKAGIMLDDWKLPIFKKALGDAGFEYEQSPGITEDTLLLTVKTDDLHVLSLIVQKANNDAAKSKMN